MGNEFRSGFVTIIGAPNAGKSTLINRVVGQKISIVSQRAQTTRNRIMGVYNDKNLQMVFIDTPGVTLPKNRLGEYMLKVAYDQLNEVDAILFITDATIGFFDKDKAIAERLSKAKAPVIVAINKTDVASTDQVDELESAAAQYSFVKSTVKISAKEGNGVKELLGKLSDLMETGPMYFPEDMVTDMPERFIIAEIIREKALMLLRDEIPHGVGVDIEKISVREKLPGKSEALPLTDVFATILCERESHKGIIIGKNGSMLKQIGAQARRDIEWLLGSRVNLQLHVKVKSDWRNSAGMLKELGYE